MSGIEALRLGAAYSAGGQAGCLRYGRGFTLIEMLVVIAIISTLLAIGAITFQRQSARMKADAVAATLDTAIRQARNSAISTGAPAFVELDDQSDPQRVVAWGYRVVGLWHFEDGGFETKGAFGHRGIVRGCKPAEGKIGKCLNFALGGSVDCGSDPDFDLDDGGYLEAFVLGAADFTATQFIFKKKNAYGFAVGRDGVLTGNVGSQELSAFNFSLPPKRWTKVAFAWDRRNSMILIDDAVVALGPAMKTRVSHDSLLVGDDSAPFVGLIDEVRVMAAIPGRAVELAGNTKLVHNAAPWKEIHFAPDGGLDVRFHTGPLTVDLIQGEKKRSVFVSMLGLTQRTDVESLVKDPEQEDKQVKAVPPPPARQKLLPALPRKPMQAPSDTDEVGKAPGPEFKPVDAAKSSEAPAEAKSEAKPDAKSEAKAEEKTEAKP
ncbi:MAG: prepilin-type N-terminal cleavage/methylation domain-containing protein [Planctomycetes bacterium]|nr:prepilin-type N-terminal cleavage/methylation domain-containing protein [Planctomycetota bacterium]